ncbi:NAD-dependent epimerase/dehydratase family protein [Micromonospora sp. NPDC051300]|uniref:NAD-dependent epimerase/dehydratase family protein n=1 Tax=Micromonospora sp. NPDC051300 TaxID=3364286 RepID=UPI00379B69FC
MRVLVTGAAGRLGGACVAALAHAGHEVVAVRHRRPVAPVAGRRIEVRQGAPADLTRDIDAIVHCAFRFAPHPAADYRRDNLDAALRLMEHGRAHGVRTFVQVSSVMVYGLDAAAGAVPLPETRSPAAVAEVLDPYPAMKIELERRLGALAERLGVNLVVIRPGILFDDRTPPVVRTVGRFGLLVGAGRNHLPFVHAADVADLVRRAVEDGRPAVYHAAPARAVAALPFARAWCRRHAPGLRVLPVPRPAYAALGLLTWAAARARGRPARWPNLRYGIRRSTRDLRYDVSRARALGWDDARTRTVQEGTDR